MNVCFWSFNTVYVSHQGMANTCSRSFFTNGCKSLQNLGPEKWHCFCSPTVYSKYFGLSPLPVRVTTRIITFLVGNPYKPSFPLLLGGGTTQQILYFSPAWVTNMEPKLLNGCFKGSLFRLRIGDTLSLENRDIIRRILNEYRLQRIDLLELPIFYLDLR